MNSGVFKVTAGMLLRPLTDLKKYLKHRALYRAYDRAFDEWEADGETKRLWDSVSSDGLEDESESWRYLLRQP